MEDKPDKHSTDYRSLLGRISDTYAYGYQKAVAAVNSNMVETYWKIGQYIVEFEQEGKSKAEYGKALLTNLSKDLSVALGKGFSLSNVYMMRQFFIKYPIFQTVSGKFDCIVQCHAYYSIAIVCKQISA